jgi:hypothetical protein
MMPAPQYSPAPARYIPPRVPHAEDISNDDANGQLGRSHVPLWRRLLRMIGIR